ncbi:hypothetical protein [Natronobacterium gregoryi]|uniref:Uncharacterized protein n=2 Tax=Natronobacterium gregoryi TaxID=44930 RepID=L0AI45_NATGS|nr:hypothetical protein [Natronobacterium gregoryi]AFZ72725.1 hypothetical protein Natgr_1519 [Natronobacterium gregoryi SP2]ELY69221.1 hypothetical protein C490_08299 [Natronobacterium gregoryi SP2]PLK18447.1 hypothetical protein CYV19_17905 [Natronobacterium gregoryi SP2]SFJ70857.1 hypothetical protein SAMN05443661_1628 [Natronobacterium gregoryi]
MVETAVGFVLGAIIGAIATAAGSSLLYWKRERDATRRLRRAFAEELRAYEYVDELVDDGGYEQVTERVEPPVIYESAADDLGLLSEDEIGDVVAFYSSLYWLEGLEDSEDKKDRIESVVEKRRTALAHLENR